MEFGYFLAIAILVPFATVGLTAMRQGNFFNDDQWLG